MQLTSDASRDNRFSAPPWPAPYRHAVQPAGNSLLTSLTTLTAIAAASLALLSDGAGRHCLAQTTQGLSGAHHPQYEEVMRNVRTAYETRMAALRQARGTANMVAELDAPSPADVARMARKYPEMLNEPKVMSSGGTITSAFSWYQKGERLRYDVETPESFLPDGKTYQIHEQWRMARGTERTIYYDVLRGDAYISQTGPDKLANLSSMKRSFSYNRLYDIGNISVPELLQVWPERGLSVSLENTELNGIQVIRLEARPDDMISQIWLAPSMSYSLVKALLTSQKDGSVLQSHEATYKESSQKGVWLLDSLYVVKNELLNPERVTFSFGPTELGVDIPDEMFTFEGLGVPVGAKLYDKVLGQTREARYGEAPSGQALDDLVATVKSQLPVLASSTTRPALLKETSSAKGRSPAPPEDGSLPADALVTAKPVLAAIVSAGLCMLLIAGWYLWRRREGQRHA